MNTEQKSFLALDQGEDFGALLDTFFRGQKSLERCLAKGYIREVGDEDVRVDVRSETDAYISEGYIPLKEFKGHDDHLPSVGDVVDVYIERFEGRDGEIVLSYERAKREAAWRELEESHEKNEIVEGVIFGRVRGGFTVNIKGIVGFLPGSQIDVRPVKDLAPLMDVKLQFRLLKMDRLRNNIVVSRRAVMEDSRSESRAELFSRLQEGQIVRGEVKNITDYGAFIDLGGVDGLLHITDISWQRIQNPRDVLSVGQELDVRIIRFNRETGRVSLGLKQLKEDPWDRVAEKYPVGSRVKGRVTNVTDYGAFVEIESGIEGLIHVSEMSWSKKSTQPARLLSTSQEVEVEVLELDQGRRRLSLGIKQCQQNPWEVIQKDFPVGTVLERKVRDITGFALFVEVFGDVDGIVHAADLSWDKSDADALAAYAKGDPIRVKVLRVDPEKEQVVLGVKQLSDDPESQKRKSLRKGDIVTCVITKVVDQGIEVSFGDDGVTGFIRRGDLSRDRSEQRADRFAVGEKVDAKIMSLEAGSSVSLSIKARELEEERELMSKHGSSDSGATLREILGVSAGLAGEASSETKDTKASSPSPKK
ncbi:30S ribosomal protein S1 [Candidatus Hepatobacter penaei]|uniref:30S ribosomal protein S1 n=1 Tax=Candidatus Hepatobacter penaei TaxID=1274402 RepID=UPI000698A4B4|nr:30S ribosomal protein S1 [Candidatus Hepatobacter penaei]